MTETELTNKQKQQIRDSRVFAQLAADFPATARQVADRSGDPETGEFCTEGQARGAMKRFKTLGLVEESDELVQDGRHAQKGWEPTEFGIDLINTVLDVFTEEG